MNDNETETLWLAAFRYYAGRRTYAVSDFCASVSDRDDNIRSARVHLGEVRARREKQRGFAFVLLGWAANARRRAARAVVQRELFA